MLMVITSAHGMHWRDRVGNHDGVFEDSVHVPLVICSVRGTEKAVVKEQVRLLDLLNTVYWQLQFSHVKESQSADIVQTIGQDSFQGYQVFLMGRDVKSLAKGYTLGYRLKGKNSENYYKYMWHSTRRQHALYNLSKDPTEKKNISLDAEKMLTTLATSTINASRAIKGLNIQEEDRKVENLTDVSE